MSGAVVAQDLNVDKHTCTSSSFLFNFSTRQYVYVLYDIDPYTLSGFVESSTHVFLKSAQRFAQIWSEQEISREAFEVLV